MKLKALFYDRDSTMTAEEALLFAHEKVAIYRALFTPIFSEGIGFKSFLNKTKEAGLSVGIGTAGDAPNVTFALSHLKPVREPSIIVRADMGLAGKPEPAIFSLHL